MSKRRSNQQPRKIWFRRVEQWRASGLSQAEFCRRHKLHSGNFYNWTAKYRRQYSEQRLESAKLDREVRTLIPVEFEPSPGAVTLSCGDVRIHFEQGLTPDLAQQWIKTLRAGLC